MLVEGTVTVNNTGTATAPNNRNKKVILKNLAPFTNCISEINNTQVDNAKDIDIVMPMHNLLEYSGNYSKTLLIMVILLILMELTLLIHLILKQK